MSKKTDNICGCTGHSLELNDPNTVLFRGQKWNAICALKETVRLLDKDKETIDILSKDTDKYKSLLKDLEDVICPLCYDPIGKDWVLYTNMICCNACASKSNPHIPF